MSDQMVFKRYEIKYMVTREQKERILKQMQPYMRTDCHGRSTILSLYMDTPDFLLARRSMEHPLYKEKLRMRSYGIAKPDATVFLELKKKYDGVVYKRRECMTRQQLEACSSKHRMPKDTQIMRELAFALNRYSDIRPAILLSYEREAYYAREDHEFRITFDENVLWRDYDLNLYSGVYGESIISPQLSIMEVKTAGAIPMWLVKVLSQEQIYSSGFSKYGTAYTRRQTIEKNGGKYKYA